MQGHEEREYLEKTHLPTATSAKFSTFKHSGDPDALSDLVRLRGTPRSSYAPQDGWKQPTKPLARCEDNSRLEGGAPEMTDASSRWGQWARAPPTDQTLRSARVGAILYAPYDTRRLYSRLDCSPPTKANRVQSPNGSPPDVRKWGSCRTMPLVGEFSKGTPLSSALAFRRCPILTSFHPHQLFKPRSRGGQNKLGAGFVPRNVCFCTIPVLDERSQFIRTPSPLQTVHVVYFSPSSAFPFTISFPAVMASNVKNRALRLVAMKHLVRVAESPLPLSLSRPQTLERTPERKKVTLSITSAKRDVHINVRIGSVWSSRLACFTSLRTSAIVEAWGHGSDTPSGPLSTHGDPRFHVPPLSNADWDPHPLSLWESLSSRIVRGICHDGFGRQLVPKTDSRYLGPATWRSNDENTEEFWNLRFARPTELDKDGTFPLQSKGGISRAKFGDILREILKMLSVTKVKVKRQDHLWSSARCHVQDGSTPLCHVPHNISTKTNRGRLAEKKVTSHPPQRLGDIYYCVKAAKVVAPLNIIPPLLHPLPRSLCRLAGTQPENGHDQKELPRHSISVCSSALCWRISKAEGGRSCGTPSILDGAISADSNWTQSSRYDADPNQGLAPRRPPLL
ncbi:hypothetical protein PR048_014207 [Dryococelus australis]|uniref:Uncharacterized protein n=1 Tax=Dryococelus australis TaxID=614101 RepID=A0ABQ9HDR6_9NEOP|nr:hypothetical protein PR048_014207 [Dryococelus australis]